MPTKTEHIVESPEPGFAVPEIAFGRYFRNKIVDIIADCPDKIAVVSFRLETKHINTFQH